MAFIGLVLFAAPVSAVEPLRVVAAENFYGDIARQIGGSDIEVTSILGNPDQDPHQFEASPSVARELSAAGIVIYNGIDYDPWMDKLLASARSDNRTAIVVANLIGSKAGDNPHIWYDPNTMLALARDLAATLASADPAHADGYRQRLQAFEQSMQSLQARIATLRSRLAGTQVAASEPVFGYVFDALSMKVQDQSFQLAVMNNTEPSASDIATMENDLKMHRVRLFVYNSQASDPMASHMEKLAKASGIATMGATETEPPDTRYQDWMLSELDAIDKVLPN